MLVSCILLFSKHPSNMDYERRASTMLLLRIEDSNILLYSLSKKCINVIMLSYSVVRNSVVPHRMESDN